MSLHRCTEPECRFVGQRSGRSCLCHKTDEQVLRERVAGLVAALKQAEALIGVTLGEGPDAIVPATVPTRIGVPVQAGAIMASIRAAIDLSKETA